MSQKERGRREAIPRPIQRDSGMLNAYINRRQALKLLALAGAGLMLKDRELVQPEADVFTQPADTSNGEIQGSLFPKAKIVSIQELGRIYADALRKNRRYDIDPSIVSSTIYHGVNFFTADKSLALAATSLLSSGEATSCGAEYCTYDTSRGVAMEIRTKPDRSINTERQRWISSINSSAHESYHLSVGGNKVANVSEDYGVLGVLNISGGKRGFWHAYGSENPFVPQLLTTTVKLPNGSRIYPNTLEELFAEWGRVRFYKNLIASSKLKDFPEARMNYSGYPMFERAVTSLEDLASANSQTEDHKYVKGALAPNAVDRFHLTGDRYGLLLGMGEAVSRVNPSALKLSRPDIAALGLVMLTDFAQYDISNNNIFFSLLKNPVSPDLILQKAKEVIALKAV